MDCVYLLSADYVEGFEVFLKFNTGESGRVDCVLLRLINLIHRKLR